MGCDRNRDAFRQLFLLSSVGFSHSLSRFRANGTAKSASLGQARGTYLQSMLEAARAQHYQ
jgi:hypothetical protein